jgi:hypothetical protein
MSVASTAITMRFTYRLQHEEDGVYCAECIELEVAGEGESEGAAVDSLRDLLFERLCRPDAVAPPSVPRPVAIELTRLPDD